MAPKAAVDEAEAPAVAAAVKPTKLELKEAKRVAGEATKEKRQQEQQAAAAAKEALKETKRIATAAIAAAAQLEKEANASLPKDKSDPPAPADKMKSASLSSISNPSKQPQTAAVAAAAAPPMPMPIQMPPMPVPMQMQFMPQPVVPVYTASAFPLALALSARSVTAHFLRPASESAEMTDSLVPHPVLAAVTDKQFRAMVITLHEIGHDVTSMSCRDDFRGYNNPPLLQKPSDEEVAAFYRNPSALAVFSADAGAVGRAASNSVTGSPNGLLVLRDDLNKCAYSAAELVLLCKAVAHVLNPLAVLTLSRGSNTAATAAREVFEFFTTHQCEGRTLLRPFKADDDLKAFSAAIVTKFRNLYDETITDARKFYIRTKLIPAVIAGGADALVGVVSLQPAAAPATNPSYYLSVEQWLAEIDDDIGAETDADINKAWFMKVKRQAARDLGLPTLDKGALPTRIFCHIFPSCSV